jgi:hypothetical protein
MSLDPPLPSKLRSEHTTARPSPRWVRFADLATIILLCAALWVVASGGLRTSIDGVRISVTSAVRLTLFAVAIAAMRHALRPRPSLLESVRVKRPQRLPVAWSATAPVWAVSRISVILAGYFAVLIIGFPAQRAVRFSDSTFLNLLGMWDAAWYVDIAVYGYRWHGVPYKQQNVAFFPAFPMVMRAGGALLGAYQPDIRPPAAERRMLVGGWLVALGTFWLALVYVYRWSEARAGPSVAKASITLLAAYPFAVFFSAPYTEALYLLGAAAAFFHFERGEWLRCACWGFLVGLVRPNGVLLAIPLLLMALQWRMRKTPFPRPGPRSWIALTAPLVALALHSLFIHQLTGRWFAWSEVQAAWGRTYQLTTWLGLGLSEITELGAVQYVEGAPATTLNALALTMALVLLWPVTRTAGLPYAVFVLVNLVPAIASGGLLSVGRFTSTLYPLFFALAFSIREQSLTLWIVGFSVLQGLLAALFFTGRPPY